MTWRSCLLVLVLGWCAAGALSEEAAPAPAAQARANAVPSREAYLEAADQYVLKSDKYLHHSKLRRGQKGFGRTVLQGTQIVVFQAEILSVMKNWNPHQDVILARLATQNLENTGVIAGMSGSPVYVTGDDGKERMIGAVAYGWRGQKEPICGIQPIAQMLAVAAMQGRIAPLKAPGAGGESGGTSSKPSGAAPAADGKAAWSAGAAVMGHRPLGRGEHARAFLDPHKLDFSAVAWGEAADARKDESGVRLAPLSTPLMVRGLNPRTVRRLAAEFEPAGLVPVQAGGVSAGDKAARKGPDYAPGSAVAVALVTGDADMSGVGTVTEVVGDRVLAFGHAMFGEGEVNLPMGPAYVHGVIATILGSFKLGATIDLTGTLSCDEKVGVCGIVGRKPQLVPFNVNVDWKGMGGKRTFHYQVARHRMLTAALTRMLVIDSATTWQEVPELHTVTHDMKIDFGPLGVYRARNTSSMIDLRSPASDLGRAVAGLLNNPFGPPADLRSIDLDITIQEGSTLAKILDLKLDGAIYRPGQTLTGEVVVLPFRGERTSLPVRFVLPDDLAEGKHKLIVCCNTAAKVGLQAEKPHRFDPRNMQELFAAIQEVVEGDARDLYLRMGVGRQGLALDRRELDDLPSHWSAVLAEAGRIDANAYASALERTQRTKFVLDGLAVAEFEVRKEIDQTLLRGK
ncbi:MAG TPA: hypothetical protein PKG77_19250 [Phycisphaerae bacterium]|nr:hypothetical protein [Phycisphaerae bacterium]HQL74738.1 hypothetical protein [Phycisphaerae bacterium]